MKFLGELIARLILISLLFFNLFVSNNVSKTFTLIVLVVFLIYNFIVHKFYASRYRGKSEALTIVFGMCFVIISFFYLLGFFSGFRLNYSVIFKNYIKASEWINVFLIVFITEMSRYLISQEKYKSKKQYYFLQALMLVAYVLIDLSIATKIYDLTSFNQFYEFFALVLVQSVSKNLLLNYTCRKYGYETCLVYRLIMDLYIYFIPVVPKLNIFIEAVLLLIFPYIVFLVLQAISERKILEPARKRTKKYDKFLNYVSVIVFAILVCLVSREFEYCMIGVGSGSMTGTIDKGDAIVYKKYEMGKELHAGDVIVFSKNDRMIVHRIDKKFKVDNGNTYKTKGDANDSVDNWIVTEDEIIGVVEFKVLWIAWPSVIINEIF